MSSFGEWLKATRKRLSISRERLAADAGISYQTVQNAELGKPVLPMTERVLRQAVEQLDPGCACQPSQTPLNPEHGV